jgi:hypothetical protein
MWHFTTLDKKLGYGDGRPIIAGEKLTMHRSDCLTHSNMRREPISGK